LTARRQAGTNLERVGLFTVCWRALLAVNGICNMRIDVAEEEKREVQVMFFAHVARADC
jgi:hypothetical protein